MLMNMLLNSSGIAIVGVLVALVTVVFAAAYAVRPNERRLSLLRPLSLATIFAALCSLAVGIVNVLVGISNSGQLTADSWARVAAGTAEAFIPLFLGFGSLTIAWILVAVGLRRT